LGTIRVCVVKDTSSTLRFFVVFRLFPHALAVILTDQRTAAFSLCGLAATRAGGAGGRRAQNEKPAGGFFRAGGDGVRSVGSVATQFVSVH